MPYEIPTRVDEPLLIHGDNLDELPKIPSNSVDSYVSDPPSATFFMSAKWDDFRGYRARTEAGRELEQRYRASTLPAAFRVTLREEIAATILRCCTDAGQRYLKAIGGEAGARRMALSAVAEKGLLEPGEVGFVVYMVEHWVEVLRVLKPGAYAVAWALPKTSDLAGLAMRLAGFIPDNPLLHLFSSAMAKGQNPGKKIDAMMGAEREIVGVHVAGADPGVVDLGRGRGGACESCGRQRGGQPTNCQCDKHGTPATELAAAWEDFNSQLAPGFEHWLVGQKPIEGATPPRLRELTGLDYAWSPRKVKTAKARRQVARDFVGTLTDLEPTSSQWAKTVTSDDWVAAVRMCDALARIEAGGTWQRRSGRSLRPDHPNIEQLLLDGEVVGERVRGKYSGAPIKTIAANCIAHGVGAYHIGACRIPRGPAERARVKSKNDKTGLGIGEVYGDGERVPYEPGDGYPKTVLLSPGGERCPAKALDAQSGVLKTAVATKRNDATAFSSGTKTDDNPTRPSPSHAGEPDAGCSKFYTNLPIDDPALDPFLYTPKARKRHAGLRSDIENKHNTLKTTALMRWIIRLVCPPGGVILSTFGGSGTDAVAAIAEGMRIVIMERRADYFELMCSRVAAAIGSPEKAAEANDAAPVGGQLLLI